MMTEVVRLIELLGTQVQPRVLLQLLLQGNGVGQGVDKGIVRRRLPPGAQGETEETEPLLNPEHGQGQDHSHQL